MRHGQDPGKTGGSCEKMEKSSSFLLQLLLIHSKIQEKQVTLMSNVKVYPFNGVLDSH